METTSALTNMGLLRIQVRARVMAGGS